MKNSGSPEKAEKVRILQLISDLDIGGTEIVLKSLVERLDKDRFDVIVCSIKPIGQIGRDLQSEGFKVVSLGIESKMMFPFALLRLASLVRNERISIIQSYLFPDNVLSRFVRLFVPVKVINGKRDTDAYKSAVRVFIDNITSGLAQVTVSNSKAGMDELTKRGVDKRKVRFIPSGIDISLYSSRRDYRKLSEDSDVSIGVVAKLRMQKGHTYLFRALRQVINTYPHAKLYVVGDGPLRDQLFKEANELGINNNVSFMGDRKDVPDLLAHFDLFVLPSLWEGTPRALLEAMAAGVPIIATGVDGNSEVIEDGRNGLLVKPKDPALLESAIMRAIKSEILRKGIGISAQKDVINNYSLGKMVKTYESLYDELV